MTKNKIVTRVLIADDHPIFRDGLKKMLASEPRFKIVGEACDGDEVLAIIERLKPDILLLDLRMPKIAGLRVLELLADTRGTVKPVMLAAAASSLEISRAFKLGARGFVLKESAPELLFNCIDAVMAGQYWVGHQSVKDLTQILGQCRRAAKNGRPINYGLTTREMEIVRAAVLGHSNKEIAARLGISEQTVKHHITSIFDRLGVYNRLELTLFVFHHNLIEE